LNIKIKWYICDMDRLKWGGGGKTPKWGARPSLGPALAMLLLYEVKKALKITFKRKSVCNEWFWSGAILKQLTIWTIKRL